MSKGSRPRPCNKRAYDANFDRIFGPRPLPNEAKQEPLEKVVQRQIDESNDYFANALNHGWPNLRPCNQPGCKFCAEHAAGAHPGPMTKAQKLRDMLYLAGMDFSVYIYDNKRGQMADETSNIADCELIDCENTFLAGKFADMETAQAIAAALNYADEVIPPQISAHPGPKFAAELDRMIAEGVVEVEKPPCPAATSSPESSAALDSQNAPNSASAAPGSTGKTAAGATSTATK